MNVDRLIATLQDGRPLRESEVRFVCEKVKEILLEESNVICINPPVTVVGDIHGQLYDLLELFRIGGQPPDTNYLFLGDYVDRGYDSVETISLLLCLKLRYPHRVAMLRGNHETRSISQIYGFHAECLRKYNGSSVAWQCFMDVCDYLSISATISGSVFCVHGGLSPSLHALDQLRVLHRFAEVPHEGPISDLLWSDPDPSRSGWCVSARGAGYTYGEDILETFLHNNALDHVLRAHQLCLEGYQILFHDRLSTVWSAPNYCYRCKNVASILEVGENLERTFNFFYEAPPNARKDPPDAAALGARSKLPQPLPSDEAGEADAGASSNLLAYFT
eukprot:TRINITY_DN5998_c0_g1_i1.p1 TRINITY_DN5998_c0_g1~~TRINITY_DN5998_c0_g1_i1.p1  ORF type:complete len:333 (+),score=83.57 TRINITY_DN5998_c0_g1_i1:89-1087(+)